MGNIAWAKVQAVPIISSMAGVRIVDVRNNMQFKLGKHMQPADMMRQAGRRQKPHVKSHEDYAREFRKSGNSAEDWNEGEHAYSGNEPEHMSEADYKSRRRNLYRELKNFGKQADEKRKKMEGRGKGPYPLRLPKMSKWEKEELERRKYLDKNWEDLSEEEQERRVEFSHESQKKGRGGYSYADIHKTPLKKLVAGAHAHRHHYEDGVCEDCGHRMSESEMEEAEARGLAQQEADEERRYEEKHK